MKVLNIQQNISIHLEIKIYKLSIYQIHSLGQTRMELTISLLLVTNTFHNTVALVGRSRSHQSCLIVSKSCVMQHGQISISLLNLYSHAVRKKRMDVMEDGPYMLGNGSIRMGLLMKLALFTKQRDGQMDLSVLI